MKLWMVGRPLAVDGVEIGWMAEGAFQTEQEAVDAVMDDEFVILADVGSRFPARAVDAEKLYYPRQETWEQSALYRIRHG